MADKCIILFFPLTESGGGRQKEKHSKQISNIPWSVLSLERMVRDLDIDVILIDERLDRDYEHILINNKERILFAGVSSLLGRQIEGGIYFVEKFRSICNAPVVWGGWFATSFPEVILNECLADYVCIGQGEVFFRSFTEKMLKNEELYEISGLAFKQDGKIVINKSAKLINPAVFPKVNLDLIDINKLIDINFIIPQGSRGVDYIATYGCTNKCGFCSVVPLFGSRWFARDVTDVIDDLKYFKKKAGISHVTFWDENIFAHRKFILELCRSMISSELGLTWGGYAHIGYFLKHYTDEDLELIYEAGCRDIRLGAESGDQETLDFIQKGIRVEDTIALVKRLKKSKFVIRIFLMACFPLKPDVDFWKSLRLMGKVLLIDSGLYVKMRFFVPLPGTALYQPSVDKGLVLPENAREIVKFFMHSFTFNYRAPWVKRDYQSVLNTYVKFYFLFSDFYFYKCFPAKYRPFGFMLALIMYPVVHIRVKLNFLRFPFEAWLFGKLFPYEEYHKLKAESYMMC